MSLLKTAAELKAVLPRISNLTNSATLPNMDRAGRIHIIPLVGEKLYDSLNEKYNSADELNDNEKKLLKHIQLPLAAFSLCDDLPFIQTMITDNGLRTPSTEQLQAAHRWEFKEIQEALITYACDGAELLLRFLVNNKADWPDWADSPEYKNYSDNIIRSGDEFDQCYHIHQPLRTFHLLKPLLQDVEENYLSSSFGRDLLKWIKSQDEIIVTGDGGEVDVKKLIKKAAAFLTIKLACEHLPTRFGTSGFTVLSAGGDRDNPENSGRELSENIKQKKDVSERDGINYLSKSCYYLKGIASGLFSESFSDDFTTAFEKSPLNKANAKKITRGNERRKFFRF